MYLPNRAVKPTLANMQSKSLRYRDGDRSNHIRISKLARGDWHPTVCQFIEGEYTRAEMRQHGDHIKCGGILKPESSYCEAHHKRCFTPLTAKKDLSVSGE